MYSCGLLDNSRLMSGRKPTALMRTEGRSLASVMVSLQDTTGVCNCERGMYSQG